MPSQQAHLRSVTPPDGGSSGDTARQQARQRAAKGLPTDRIKMDRQFGILPTIGRLSGPHKDPITADRLAKAVGGGIAPATVMLSNRFFADAGWITVPGKGLYAATDALVEYTRRLATDTPDRAALALHEPVRRSWFWLALEPHFANGKIRLNEAEIVLMTAADAADGHAPMIRNLITWLEYVGLIVVNDQFIALNDETARTAAPVTDGAPAATPDRPEKVGTTGTDGTKPTEQAGERTPAPVISLSFEVKITVDDLARLSADQITALFAAVGTVAAVKGRQ